MIIIRAILALCAVTALLALPAGAAALQTTSLTGTATLSAVQGSAPAGAMLTVQIREVRADGAPVIATQQSSVTGKVSPYAFTLNYDPARIDQNLTYMAEASYSINGQVRYQTNTQYPVITKGNPTTVNMTLEPVQLPNTTSGTTLLALAALALALALGARLLRARGAAWAPPPRHG